MISVGIDAHQSTQRATHDLLDVCPAQTWRQVVDVRARLAEPLWVRIIRAEQDMVDAHFCDQVLHLVFKEWAQVDIALEGGDGFRVEPPKSD